MHLIDQLDRHGFAVIDMNASLNDAAARYIETAARFFALDHHRKMSYWIGHSEAHRGYVPAQEHSLYPDEGRRLYESFDTSTLQPWTDGDKFHGINHGPQWLLDAELRYRFFIQQLSAAITGQLSLELYGNPQTVNDKLFNPVSQIRCIHYLPNGDDAFMGAHTDYELFTLLYQQSPGIVVKNTDDKWLAPEVGPGQLLVMAGDMLEVMSNGRWQATPHRVSNSGQERYSLAYFQGLNYTALVEPVGSVREWNYTPMFFGNHLRAGLERDFSYLRGAKPVPAKTQFERRCHD